MAWTTPGTATAGEVLTAAFWNTQVRDNLEALPQGIIGFHSLETAFTTSPTHTTYQDEGLSASVSYRANRRLRITLNVRPYPSGGLQGITFQVLRGATVVMLATLEPATLQTTTAAPVTLQRVFNGPATAATETFKVQIRAVSSNTAVQSYGAPINDGNRQLIIEDCGPA